MTPVSVEAPPASGIDHHELSGRPGSDNIKVQSTADRRQGEKVWAHASVPIPVCWIVNLVAGQIVGYIPDIDILL